MNIKTYKEKYDIKNERTILKWLEMGYITGATKNGNGEWEIPNNARKPYVFKKPKKHGIELYKSFLQAYSRGECIVPLMYGITHEKFDFINKNLLEKELIEEELLDGLIYYNITEKGQEYISPRNTELYKIFKDLYESSIRAVAGAFLQN